MKTQLLSKYPWKSSREPLGVRELQVENPCTWCEWHHIFITKTSHRIKEQPFIKAGVSIPEGALLRGFHCISKGEKCVRVFLV